MPFAAYAQTAQSTPPNANQNNSDEEDTDEEEPAAAPATPAASGETPSTETPSTEAPAPPTPGTPEADDERRTRMLPRYSSLDGSIGLLHTSSAQTGAAGSFRFGVMGEYFNASDFLRPGALPGTAFVGGTDTASHVGGTLTFSYSPLDWLEAYASIRAYANSNDRERPSLFQVLGDTNVGLKAAGRLARGFYLGGDASVYLLNRSGDVGLLLDSTSFQLRLLTTLDLKEITGSVPLRFHLNARYYFDNSASIVSDTEARRRAAQPGFDPSVCATTNDARCYLEVSRIERFALGINRVDQMAFHVGVDVNLPYINPFLEWTVNVPVNRQGYQCYSPGTMGTRPGGGADDDACLGDATSGFSAFPSRLTVGTRVLPPVRGLAATVAFDIATGASSSFVREVSPLPPWQLFFGASFAYDVHQVAQRIEVPGPERVVDRPVDRTPPGARVVGTVRDAESHAGVAHAFVTFTGHPDMSILGTAANGQFVSGRLPPGDYRVHVEADGYNANDCNFTIAAPAAPATPAPGATPTAGAPAAPAAADADVTTNCELRAMPRRGGINVHVVSSRGGAPVANATVTLTPAQGQTGAQEQTLTTDAQGAATATEILAGPYTVTVGPTPQHMATTPQPVTVEPRRTIDVNVTATRRPLVPGAVLRGGIIAIARQVHFQTNSAEILPDSNTLLEEIADVVRRNAGITMVEIQGHTDNQGAPATNLTLSQNRAEAVRDALVRLGIAADRLSARGLGQTRPIRPNLTAVGRAANRRVEFHVGRGGAAPR